MWGKNLVISKAGGEYQIPSLLKIEKTKNMKRKIKLSKDQRSTYDYHQDCHVHDEYQDGSHDEPQDDHGYQDNDNEIDRHDQQAKEGVF